MSKYQELSDIELIKSIAKYDSRAMEELYNRYSPVLFTLIKKISPDEKTAEEVLVDVFSIIWRKIDTFNYESENVYTWIISLARNCAVDKLRRSRSISQTKISYDDEYENFFILPTLSEKTDKIDFNTAMNFKPKMEAALAKLTDAQKYVIHLAYYEGYNLDEIADKLNIPVETVRAKIMTALQNLRDHLSS